jgi:hypothetical protein
LLWPGRPPSAGEEFGRNPKPGFHGKTLEGRNPREHPAVGVLTTCPVARDSREGQSPETETNRADPSFRRRVHRAVKRQVGSFVRKRSDTFREGKASKGESQERRRCETKPAGVRREETVERVIKP